MKLKLKRLKDQVIFITGASSGIGLRTAQMAALRGAKVMLVARNEDVLKVAGNEIRAKGGQAEYAVADVADLSAVEGAAKRALDTFGQIDTWMNIAGVGIYGVSRNVPLTEARRLFDVNFWGVVHGTRTALTVIGKAGGVILNMGSVESTRPMPYHSFYSASKHAIKAYTDTVRMEAEKEGLPIALTLIKPASINTPFIDNTENHLTDAAPRYLPPAYSVDVAARAILGCCEHPQREITIGGSGKVIEFLEMMAPRMLDRILEATAFRAQERRSRPSGHNSNLYSPFGKEPRTVGTHNGYVARTSVTTSASMFGPKSLLLSIGLGAATTYLLKALSVGERTTLAPRAYVPGENTDLRGDVPGVDLSRPRIDVDQPQFARAPL